MEALFFVPYTPFCPASHPVVRQKEFRRRRWWTVFILACLDPKGQNPRPTSPLTALEVDWGQWGWVMLR